MATTVGQQQPGQNFGETMAINRDFHQDPWEYPVII